MDKITEAVENLRLGMVRADKALLETVTVDELSYGHTSGVIENKLEFIDAIVGDTKRDVFKQIDISEQKISIVGETAIVRNCFKAEVLVNGTLIRPDIKVLQVWVLKSGEWKLLARQAYKV